MRGDVIRCVKKLEYSKTFPSQFYTRVLTKLKPGALIKSYFPLYKRVISYKNNTLAFLNHEGKCDKVSQEARVLKNLPKSVLYQGANQAETWCPYKIIFSPI